MSYVENDPLLEPVAPTDSELAARVYAGNADANDAFATFWMRHAGALLSIAYSCGAMGPDAEDAVQEVGERIFRNARARQLEFPRPNSARGYGATAVRRQVRDQWRRAAHQHEVPTDDFSMPNLDRPAPFESSPEVIATSTETVQRILALLKPIYRDAVQAIVIDGRSESDYAKEIGRKPVTARTRAYKASQNCVNFWEHRSRNSTSICCYTSK